MPAKLVIVSENTKSNALKVLADKLSEKVGYRVYRVSPHRVRNRVPVVFNSGLDKITQLRSFKQHNVAAPDFVEHVDELDKLDCKRIVARQLVNSSEGKGIVVFDKGTTPPSAPLYTAYVPKRKEFRVHVWNNEVIDVQEKRKSRSFDGDRDTFVRNTVNGYVFCRTDIREPEDLRPLAISAVVALERRYGAVDIIWNESQNKCFVLEVNSRPGMEGTTVDKYADAIVKGLVK